MRTASLGLVLLGAVGLLGCGAQTSGKPATSPVATNTCRGLEDLDAQVAALYAPGAIQRAEPIYRREFVVRAYQPRVVRGASLYVPAQADTNSAYLQRVLTCHAASTGIEHPNDPLRAEGVERISVETAGPMFRISVLGVDRAAGRTIWERAQAITQQTGDVEVEQLSAAPADHGSF